MGFDKTQASYQSLRSIIAERSDAMVAWIGSGLSKSAGLPTWEELKTKLCDALHDISMHMDDGSESETVRRFENEARTSNDYWSAFALLKNQLGKETFRSVINNELSKGNTVRIPNAYLQLWKLRLAGVINLNIDRLCIRSFHQLYPTRHVNEFPGSNLANHMHLLRADTQWIASLHGELEDYSTWVFTTNDLKELNKKTAYGVFLNTCFASKTVVFIGITAEDRAAGGQLELLTKSGIDLGGHYWITHRTDAHTRMWAENAGIRIIHYSAIGHDHSELQEVLTDLETYKPVDPIPTPVVATSLMSTSHDLPLPREIQKLEANEIREMLNSYAADLLKQTNDATIAKFAEFSRKYAQPIYRAWYVSVDDPDNLILNYKITEKVAEGAFGTVYRANDDTGNEYAIKILHERVRNSHEMLQCFRRGVKSMRLLTDNKIPGVVRFYEASEIPAMVVMDYIYGPDLSSVVKQGALKEWSHILKVAIEITGIIRRSHKLPQRVLHRDIRPSNILLESCWGNNPEWSDVKVVILDFDLSWHIDSFDVSITNPGTLNGYLAPEQVERNSRVSTRNAAVDSFGLGMTLYYMRTGKDPRYGEQRYAAWAETLKLIAEQYPCSKWHSLPMRYSRLLLRATREIQSERADVANIESELLTLFDALHTPQMTQSAELIAEELFARSFKNAYVWNDSTLEATYDFNSVHLKIMPVEKDRTVRLLYKWLQNDQAEHSSIKRWLPTAKTKSLSSLSVAGWHAECSIDTGTLFGQATISVDEAIKNMSKVASSIHEVYEALTLT